jgi:hydrogenase small subunit
MPAQAAPYGRVTQKAPAVAEVHILWITAGLSCDGDSVSVTAAMQPSIEDVLLGAIPGLPKVHLHNPVLAYECGDDFMKYFYMAEEGNLEPFVLVIEGSIPNEKAIGRLWAPIPTPGSRSRQMSGLIAWPRRRSPSSPPEHAPPTAAFMRWKAIRREPWV